MSILLPLTLILSFSVIDLIFISILLRSLSSPPSFSSSNPHTLSSILYSPSFNVYPPASVRHPILFRHLSDLHLNPLTPFVLHPPSLSSFNPYPPSSPILYPPSLILHLRTRPTSHIFILSLSHPPSSFPGKEAEEE